MPIPKGLYGDPRAIGTVGDRQVVANPATKQASAPIELSRWFRNGLHPASTALNLMNESANQAVLYRTKTVGYFAGRMGVMNSFGAGDRARYRFACHAGPYTHVFFAFVALAQPTSGFTNNTKARLDIANGAGTVVASQEFVYGVDPTNGGAGNTHGWQYVKFLPNYVDGVSADTDLYGTFYDVDYGRIVCATVVDLQSATENLSGYLSQSATMNSAIVDKDRQGLAEMVRALWKSGGSSLINFSVDDGTAPVHTAIATLANVADSTVTGAPTASTPGYTLVLNGKDRASAGGQVPCVMKAYGKCSIGASGSGTVYLKNSSNTTVASCVFTTSMTTGQWVSSGTFNLPATTAKYDLQLASAGGGFDLYAASVYEYET